MKSLNDIEFLETLKQSFSDAKTGREATFNNAIVNRISDLQKKLDKKGILVEDGVTQLKYESGVRYRVSYSHKNYYFYTLEEARTFRDGTLTLKDKELVQKELNNISKELDIKEFPYNFLDALLKDSKVEYDINYVLDNLDKNLIYIFENFNFTKKEGKVLCERFIHLRTLEETGKIIGLTRERIRQIEIRTIRKLKHPSRLKIILYGPESLSLNEDIKKLREQISAEKNRLIKEYEQLLKNGLTDKEKEEFINSKECYLHEPISTLNLTVRSYNCLVRANIATINDLVSLSKEELLNIRNLGRKSFKEIVEMVENAYNLEFRKP